VLAVRDHLDLFGDATIAVVTFASSDRLSAYREHVAIPFVMLADTDRALYQAVGAERGTWRQVWSFGTIKLYARLLRKGRRLKRPFDDTRQLGADVVVGRDGRVRFIARPDSPDRRPPIEALIAALD
jgi:peroxiredoxin